jgi:signal peptidase II
MDLDFFDISIGNFQITRWAVFNVADACVTVGVILLVLFHRSAEPPVPAAP